MSLTDNKSKAYQAKIEKLKHDIQSPLGALIAASNNLDGNKEKSTELIKKSVDRIKEIIKELDSN